MFGSRTLQWKVWWTLSLRGRRSRNKVSVSEPAEGSFARFRQHHVNCFVGVCVRMCLDPFMQMPEGGGALMTSVLSSFLLPWCNWNAFKSICTSTCNFSTQLSAMDVSVRSTMKGAAKCDKHCELQNSVNRQELERILCFRDIPDSMPASVCMFVCSSGCCSLACCCDCLRIKSCWVCTLEASDVQVVTSAVTCLSVVCIARCFIDVSYLPWNCVLWRMLASSNGQDMKSGSQTRWI